MEPILVIPWSTDFIPVLKDHLLDLDPRETLVVLTHHRPARLLAEAFRTDDSLRRPLVLPETAEVSELLRRLRALHLDRPLRRIDPLDQVGLLFEVAQAFAGEGGLPDDLPADRRRFFPWGLRLARIFEELFRQGMEPGDLHPEPGEVLPWAEALLTRLGRIFRAYRDQLETRGWTTAGLDIAWIGDNLNTAASAVRQQRVVLAGFYALSGIEDLFFRRLWEDGRLTVLWHSDPALAQGGHGHFAVEEHRQWRKRWGAPVELLAPEAAPPSPPQLRFFEGCDLHSQLKVLAAELAGLPDLSSTAVVIPDPSMLMPVLHSLPERDFNVTMGYPLGRASVHRLLEAVLALHEHAENGRYHWRDGLNLIRHPYLKMLRAGDISLRTPLHALETRIRNGTKFIPASALAIHVADLSEGTQPEAAQAAQDLVARIASACLDGFAAIETLADLASAIRRLGQILLDHGGHLWREYPLDAETLYRLFQEVLPTLEGSAISREPLGRAVLFPLLRQLIEAESVPFEAEPLTSLQVIGILETRLLHFRRVFIVGASDDKLPGSPPHDPLLPDPLRVRLGLPDSRKRDNVTAYNFYRLISGAEELTILYQTGSTGSALYEDKPIRSRFVEQLLFEHEKRVGQVLKPGTPPLFTIPFAIRPIPGGAVPLAKGEAFRERLLRRIEQKGLSPTAVDTYLKCPTRFCYQYLTPLRPVAEVSEDGDPGELGEVMHKTLQDFFTPHLGREIEPASLPVEELAGLFLTRLRAAGFHSQMSYDLRLAIEEAGQRRLARFLLRQPGTRIVALEKTYRGRFEVDGLAIAVEGTIDRIDMRQGRALVLDYKTGGLPRYSGGCWDDQALWDRVETWRDDGDDSDSTLLTDLAGAIGSIQLPLYLALYRQAEGTDAANAGWIELRDEGEERWLLDDPAPGTVETVAASRAPAVLALAVRHMLRSEAFTPQPSKGCQYCPYVGPCGARWR